MASGVQVHTLPAAFHHQWVACPSRDYAYHLWTAPVLPRWVATSVEYSCILVSNWPESVKNSTGKRFLTKRSQPGTLLRRSYLRSTTTTSLTREFTINPYGEAQRSPSCLKQDFIEHRFFRPH